MHLTDIMNWFMQARHQGAAPDERVGAVRPPPDAIPSSCPTRYAVTWQYKDFVATLSNTMIPGVDDARQLYGNHFFGERGVMIVNRIGYEVRPYRPTGGGRGRGQNPNAPPPPPPIEARKFQRPHRHVGDRRFDVRLGDAPPRPQLPRCREVAAEARV